MNELCKSTVVRSKAKQMFVFVFGDNQKIISGSTNSNSNSNSARRAGFMIGVALFFTLASFTSPYVLAQDNDSPTKKIEIPKVVQACDGEDWKPIYPFEDDMKREFKAADDKDLLFRLAFEQASGQYHTYVKCIFDKATINIMAGASVDTEGEFSIHSPAIVDTFGDWMVPDIACMKEGDLVKRLNDGNPGALLKVLLPVYNEYGEYLRMILKLASDHLSINQSTISDFAKLFERNQRFGLLVTNEMQNSIVAMDGAFIALKELRQAFTMHVHFMCMLKNLELYRRILGNLRSVVAVIPPLIQDASMTK